MTKFSEERLEQAIIELLSQQGYVHVSGDTDTIDRDTRDVLLRDDLREYLSRRYADDGITKGEIDHIFRSLDAFSAADLYESNKAIMKMVSDGFLLKREDRSKKDLYVELIDYRGISEQRRPRPGEVQTVVAEEHGTYNASYNICKMVNQLEIAGTEKRIPDCIIYVNGLPLVVFEFKSAIREEATIHDAYVQLTTRYRRDIPELFKYNAICIISDGVNNKAGSFFADYEFFYAWRKTDRGDLIEKDGIDSLYSMIAGMFNLTRLRDIIRNFIYFPTPPQTMTSRSSAATRNTMRHVSYTTISRFIGGPRVMARAELISALPDEGRALPCCF